MTKSYENPETLARLYFKHGNYADMAKELDCSVGTISLKMDKYEDEIEQYNEEDFDMEKEALRERVSSDELETILRKHARRMSGFSGKIVYNTTNPKFVLEDVSAAIWITNENIEETIVEADEGDYHNVGVAMSAHLAKEHEDFAEEKNVTLIAVSRKKLHVVHEPINDTPTYRFGVVPFLFSDDYKKYRNEYWLKYNLSNNNVNDISRKCSTSEDTILNLAERYGLI